MLHRNILKISCIANFSTVNVTTAMVKELRNKIGAPMMECKKALSAPDVNGDIAKAIDYLRAKGIARANQSTDRASKEGLIAVITSGNNAISLIEINSETDFVSRNQEFQMFVKDVLTTTSNLPKNGGLDVDEILATQLENMTVKDLLGDVVSKIRENIVVRRALNIKYSSPNQIVSAYVHGKVGTENMPINVEMGRVASVITATVTPPLISLSLENQICIREMLRKLSMHVVAAKPVYLSIEKVPVAVLDNEKAIFMEQSADLKAKKPEMMQKIVMGKVNKRLGEICLLSQVHVAEEGMSVVSKFLTEFSQKVGCDIRVDGFELWSLGQTS